jgi:hypothetical protein
MKGSTIAISGAMALIALYLLNKNGKSLTSIFGGDNGSGGAGMGVFTNPLQVLQQALTPAVNNGLSPTVQNALNTGAIPQQFAQNYVGLADPGNSYNPLNLNILTGYNTAQPMAIDPRTGNASYI